LADRPYSEPQDGHDIVIADRHKRGAVAPRRGFGGVAAHKVGDVQSAQGDLAGALKSYRDSLGIAEKLAKHGSAHETEKIARLAQDFEPNHVRGAFLGLHGS
jgi:hypothetical protein